MDWRTFTANLTSTLAWPIVVIVFLILARKHFGSLFSTIEKLKLPGGIEAEFKRGLVEARETADSLAAEAGADRRSTTITVDDPYLELATKFPQAAILKSYQEVEQVISGWQKANPKDKELRGSSTDVVQMLRQRKYIGRDVVKLFHDVTRTRNAAVHLGTKSITPGEALEYRSVCRDLIQSLAEGFEKFSGD
jgi:hypothetical protein